MTRPRVVLAEDHLPMAQQLRALLAPSYDVVQTVTDGAALIAAVEAQQPDLIVSDIAMPGLSGIAAARAILAGHPAARIVFVTVRNEPAVVRAALRCGVLAYVDKVDVGEELLDAMRAAATGKGYVSSSARLPLDGGE